MPSVYGEEFDRIAEALSAGNAQAYDVCRHLFAFAPRVDPDTQDQLLVMRTLVRYDVTGAQLVRLYEVACRKNLGLVMTVAHALRLNVLSLLVVKTGLLHPDTLDFKGMLVQVRAQLPNFAQRLVHAYASSS